MWAAAEGLPAMAKELIAHGADVNLQDPDLVSPMVTAIVNGHYDVAVYLVEKGGLYSSPSFLPPPEGAGLGSGAGLGVLRGMMPLGMPNWPSRLESSLRSIDPSMPMIASSLRSA